MPAFTTTILAMDFGSTHFKARVFRGGRPISRLVQVPIATRQKGSSVEILPHELEKSFCALLHLLRSHLTSIDSIIFSNQGPSLCLIDAKAKLLFPVITHLDRRSVREAGELLSEFGEDHLLSTTKNLPIPGGIASTSLRWIRNEYPSILRKTAFLGSLNTYFMFWLTRTARIDPGNAAYLGLLSGVTKLTWDSEIAAFCGASPRQLPEIACSDEKVARITQVTARRFGLHREPFVFVGTMDSSACVAAVDYLPGDIFHLSGTSDVVATVTSKPHASKKYLTRPLGFDGKWLCVRTVSAGGPTLQWGRKMFGIDPLLARGKKTGVSFAPYLAGDRLSVEPRAAEFRGITLATTPSELAEAIGAALGTEALQCFYQICAVVKRGGHRLTGRVWCSGGNKAFAEYVHRLWKKEPGKNRFRFFRKQDLGIIGLASLVARKEST